ncbi:MAG: hypothetical protein KA821_13755 [Chitinophagaceae bacterium]|nr:hypothetical protein [Chitinophagaceae bacterium]
MNEQHQGNAFDATDIAIYHLIFIGNLIEHTINSFTKIIGRIDDLAENSLWVSTNSIIIIHTISFLDEYNNFIKSEDRDLDATIKAIKKTVKPAIKQINEWKDLRDFRNNVLAHNLRNEKMAVSIFNRGLGSYDIPQTGADFAVLVNCVSMIKKTFQSAFSVKLEQVQKKIDRQEYPLKEKRFKNGNEAEAAVLRITQEINDNILELKTANGA